MSAYNTPIEVLMVDDNPGDVRLVRAVLCDAGERYRLHIVDEGQRALEFLHRSGKHADTPRPHLVILDLSLPDGSGLDVLANIKSDPALRRIPVIVFSRSQAEEDIAQSYELRANAYVSKPIALNEFVETVRAIEDFWLRTAAPPPTSFAPPREEERWPARSTASRR